MNNYLEVDVKDVKRFNSYTDGTTVHFEADPEGAWVDVDDYDAALSKLAADTLRADTAEAELARTHATFVNATKVENEKWSMKLAAAEQRVSELQIREQKYNERYLQDIDLFGKCQEREEVLVDKLDELRSLLREALPAVKYESDRGDAAGQQYRLLVEKIDAALNPKPEARSHE